MNDFYIYGASGHGKVVMETAAAAGKTTKAFIDDNKSITTFKGKEVLDELPQSTSYIIGIGNNEIRKMIRDNHLENQLVTIIHPTAIISDSSIIGMGSLVGVNAIINSDSIIGENCIINSSAIIEHDCQVGNIVHISPNATICGNVQIGEGTHVGAGAVIIPGVKIGKWSTIGAGSVVIKDVPDYCTVVGNPAKLINI